MSILSTLSSFRRKKNVLPSSSAIWAVAIAVLVLYSSWVTGCGSSTAYDPATEYANACADASNATYAKISRDLTAIVNDNSNLQWENGVVGSRVLVVAWVSAAIASHYTEGQELEFKYDLWVTVVPELKNYFGSAAPAPLRIAQLLGLPPVDATRKEYLLELWVSPENLLRPCPDPEVTDHECQLAFHGDQFWVYDNTQKVYADVGATGFKAYKDWFTNRKDVIYTSAAPYPWTRLGYTYDWGNPANHCGLSEYIVQGYREDGSGIPAKVKAVTKTADYFN
jgi:hypothetical protein